MPRECAGDAFEFVDYTPSTFEALWETNADVWAGDECSVLSRPEQRTAVNAWLYTTVPLSTPSLVATAPALLAHDEKLSVFSRMRLRYNGSLIDVGIEPVAKPQFGCPA